MTRDEETYFLRLMQVADKATIDKYFTLSKTEPVEEGAVTLHFSVVYGNDKGYLMIKYRPTDGALLAAEMDVGFPTMIGLNRSPLELRILAEHMLALYTQSS